MGKSSRKKDQIAEQIWVGRRDVINNTYNNAIAESRNDLAKNNLKNNTNKDDAAKGYDYFSKGQVVENTGKELGTSGGVLGINIQATGTKKEILGTANDGAETLGMNTLNTDNSLDEKQAFNNRVGSVINQMFTSRDEASRKNDQDYFSGALRAGIALREHKTPLAVAVRKFRRG